MNLINYAYAHGGGLDSSGGHNCYVGSCAGSYHYHRGSKNSSDFLDENFGLLLFLLVVVSIYFTLRKEQKNRLPKFKDEPLKNILEPVGLGGLADNSPEYQEQKILRIHGPQLFELEKWSGSEHVRKQSLELIEKSIALQTKYSPNYRYYKTKNFEVSTEEYPLLDQRNNIVLFVVKEGEALISIELTRDDISSGFLHPKLVIEEDNKLYELDDRGKWQIASEIKEISFDEFSGAWKKRNSEFDDTSWGSWLRDYLNKVETNSKTSNDQPLKGRDKVRIDNVSEVEDHETRLVHAMIKFAEDYFGKNVDQVLKHLRENRRQYLDDGGDTITVNPTEHDQFQVIFGIGGLKEQPSITIFGIDKYIGITIFVLGPQPSSWSGSLGATPLSGVGLSADKLFKKLVSEFSIRDINSL